MTIYLASYEVHMPREDGYNLRVRTFCSWRCRGRWIITWQPWAWRAFRTWEDDHYEFDETCSWCLKSIPAAEEAR